MNSERAHDVDLSPAAITARLREVSDIRDERVRRSVEAVDLSPAAITRRLRRVSSLRDACLALRMLGRANGL